MSARVRPALLKSDQGGVPVTAEFGVARNSLEEWNAMFIERYGLLSKTAVHAKADIAKVVRDRIGLDQEAVCATIVALNEQRLVPTTVDLRTLRRIENEPLKRKRFDKLFAVCAALDLPVSELVDTPNQETSALPDPSTTADPEDASISFAELLVGWFRLSSMVGLLAAVPYLALVWLGAYDASAYVFSLSVIGGAVWFTANATLRDTFPIPTEINLNLAFRIAVVSSVVAYLGAISIETALSEHFRKPAVVVLALLHLSTVILASIATQKVCVAMRASRRSILVALKERFPIAIGAAAAIVVLLVVTAANPVSGSML
ncbi:MAG: hypothetical protein AAF662_09560 [Pseudomonadota bacterium]